MADWGPIEVERPETGRRASSEQPETGRRPSSERQATEAASPAAEEIERVVDVAEWLGISPTVAAAALRGRDGEVRTDVRLEESIRRVERRLRRET